MGEWSEDVTIEENNTVIQHLIHVSTHVAARATVNTLARGARAINESSQPKSIIRADVAIHYQPKSQKRAHQNA
jgi:hypothetical protein